MNQILNRKYTRRCVVNGQTVDILSYEEYGKDPDKVRCFASTTVIEKTTESGKDIVLPFKGKFDFATMPTTPGVYDAGPIDFIIMPSKENEDSYIPREIVEFNPQDGIKDVLDKQEKLSKIKEPWVVDPDNITYIGIDDTNQPEMVALKTAINEKHVDFDKYAPRFGDNFPNDKRQLRGDSMTLNILKRFCRNLDLEAQLILKDKNDNVPNPLGREIVVSLTDGYDENGE